MITPKNPGTIPGTEYGLAPNSSISGILIERKTIATPNTIRTIEVTKSALGIFCSFIGNSVDYAEKYKYPAWIWISNHRDTEGTEQRKKSCKSR
jgi:hypothetical protein